MTDGVSAPPSSIERHRTRRSEPRPRRHPGRRRAGAPALPGRRLPRPHRRETAEEEAANEPEPQRHEHPHHQHRRRTPARFGQRLREILVLIRRNLIHILREPMQLSDVTIQPILFTFLFIYVFGSGIPIRRQLHRVRLAGLLAMNLIMSSNGTAVGSAPTSTRAHRPLPSAAHVAALDPHRSVGDGPALAMICTVIVLLAGFAVGWRPARGALGSGGWGSSCSSPTRSAGPSAASA